MAVGHRREGHSVLVRVAWTAVTLVITAGIPVVLLAAGAIPPLAGLVRAVVHPRTAEHLVRRPLDDVTAASLLWLCAWGAWIWLIVCVVVDLVSRLRGTPAIRIPGSRGVQSLATFLVGASLAVTSLQRHPAAPRVQAVEAASICVPAPGEPVAPTSAGTPEVSSGPADTLARGTAPTSPPARYIVKPGDSLWSIASNQLGSPLEWRRIAELNYGRPQPDGGRLLDDHWIRPGWEFDLPAPAQTVPLVSDRGVVAAAPTVAPTAPVPAAPESAVNASPPHTSSVQGADATKGAAPSRPAPPPPHAGGPSPGGHVTRSAGIPIEPIGFGILGAGVIALLDRMRRAQQRLRPAGLRISLPSGDVAELERGLRLAADAGSADWVDLSLRLLSAVVRREGIAPPRITLVRVRPDAIEFIFEKDREFSAPPPPFERSDRGHSWLLSRSRPLIDAIRNDAGIAGADAPMPGLVTLGRDEHGLLLFDLERAGSLEISGPDSGTVLQSIAVELATTSWAEQIEVLLVGFEPGIKGLERLSHARSLSAVRTRLERRVRERRTLLALAHSATNVETRWLDGGDAWDLCLALCSDGAVNEDPNSLRELIHLAGDGSLGVGVVCMTEGAGTRWRARADRGRVVLEGAGLGGSSVASQPVPDDFVHSVDSLVSAAANTAGIAPTAPPYDALAIQHSDPSKPFDMAEPKGSRDKPDPRSDEVDPASDRGVPEVVVRVLGPIQVVGSARPFTRAWALELVVYLAMHPLGVRNEQWATALWPERAMAPTTLHSTASAARRSLGTSVSGEDHLPRAHGRLRLGPGVRSDWDRFVDLSGRSRPDDWRSALELIRGRPFEELRSADWVVLEGIQATIEAVCVDVASRYADHCLSVADPNGAEWAARQGLKVSAYDERLYRVLLRAADAAGNPAGVESVMAELVHLVADDVEPFDAVHPETLSLYRELSRRSPGPWGR